MKRAMNRRDFLINAARLSIAALLGVGLGALVFRKDEACRRQGICRGCPSVSNCGLPQALSLKQMKGERDGR